MHSTGVPALCRLAVIGRATFVVTLAMPGCLGHIITNSQHDLALGPGGQGSAARDRRGVLLPAAQDRGRKAHRAAARQRRPWVFDDQRLLLLDGTANPQILRQFVPQLQEQPEIRVRRKAHFIQVRDLTFYRGSLVEKAPVGEEGARWRPKARLGAVAQFIAEVAQKGRTLVVTNK